MGAGEAMAFTESDFQSESGTFLVNSLVEFTPPFGWGNCLFTGRIRVVLYLWLEFLRCPPLGPHQLLWFLDWGQILQNLISSQSGTFLVNLLVEFTPPFGWGNCFFTEQIRVVFYL